MTTDRTTLSLSNLTIDGSLTLLAAVGTGAMAGVFFTFSSFVMPALAKLPPHEGVAAMQSINVAAINRWFMGALFGTALLCVVLSIASFAAWTEPKAKLRLLGAGLYVVGAIAVTAAFNVPRNDALAALLPAASGTPSLWARYVSEWSQWNHVRAITSALAAAVLTFAYGLR